MFKRTSSNIYTFYKKKHMNIPNYRFNVRKFKFLQIKNIKNHGKLILSINK